MMPSRALTKRAETLWFLSTGGAACRADAVAGLHGAHCIANSTAAGVYPMIRSGILVANMTVSNFRSRRSSPLFRAIQTAAFAVLVALVSTAALLASTGASRAESVYSFATTPGRLPKNVVPTHYAIDLKPDHHHPRRFRFRGGGYQGSRVHGSPGPQRSRHGPSVGVARGRDGAGGGDYVAAQSADRDAGVSACARGWAAQAAYRVHRPHQQFRPRPFRRRLSDRAWPQADDRDRTGAGRCAPGVSVLGRAGFQSELRAVCDRAAELSRALQHADCA